MGAQVWFGPFNNMQWIDAPLKGAQTTRAGVAAVTQFVNGSSMVARTGRSAAPAWSWLVDRSSAARIMALLEGVYGPPPYLYADPTILNLFPANWATPALQAQGWSPAVRVTTLTNAVQMSDNFTAQPNSDSNSPKRGAPMEILYAVQPAYDPRADTSNLYKMSIPIPPGYYLHLKTWGSVAGSAGQGTFLRCTPYSATTYAAQANVDVTPVAAGTVQSFNGNTSNRVELRWVPYNTLGTAYSPILRGATAVLTQSATPPSTFDWTPGEGLTGLDISEFPTTTSYMTPSGVRTGLEAQLQEVL